MLDYLRAEGSTTPELAPGRLAPWQQTIAMPDLHARCGARVSLPSGSPGARNSRTTPLSTLIDTFAMQMVACGRSAGRFNRTPSSCHKARHGTTHAYVLMPAG